jgi:hypothetical protein
VWREEPVCDLRDGQIGTNALEVDAHVPTRSDGVERDRAGMGHAEAQRIRVRVAGEGWLSIHVVAEGEAFWWPVQIASEDGPENATTDDEVLAVSCEMEPRSSGPFLRIKVPEETLNL